MSGFLPLIVRAQLTLQQKTAMRDNVPSDVIRFVFPPMNNGAAIMHSKLQLLKYPKYLRIAVPTGNLVPYDWGETGTMENVQYRDDLQYAPGR